MLLIIWLREHLLPCPFKFLTGLDCPGCGFQRAMLALAQGNFTESFKLYPPTIPLLLFFIYGIADGICKLDDKQGTVKKASFIIAGGIVLVSYCFKIWALYAHQIAPVAVAAIM